MFRTSLGTYGSIIVGERFQQKCSVGRLAAIARFQACSFGFNLGTDPSDVCPQPAESSVIGLLVALPATSTEGENGSHAHPFRENPSPLATRERMRKRTGG